MIAGELPTCPSGAGCPWVEDAGHRGEYRHPCPNGAACNLRDDPAHAHSFIHDPPAGAAPPAPGAGGYVPDVTHDGVTCDACRAVGFRGYRYKCMFCPDFDLCQTCADRPRVHDESHPLVRFTTKTYRSAAFMPTAAIRHGVGCGVCHSGDITGVRYVCTVDGTNLCQACEYKGLHDQSHSRIKMCLPSGQPRGPPPPPAPAPVPVRMPDPVPTHPVAFGLGGPPGDPGHGFGDPGQPRRRPGPHRDAYVHRGSPRRVPRTAPSAASRCAE